MKAAPSPLSFRRREQLQRGAVLLSLLFIVLVFAFPFYWMLKTSIEPSVDIFQPPIKLWPKHFSWEHYQRLLNESDFVTYSMNSLIVALGSMAITVVCSVLGGYALARFRVWGKKNLARFTLFSYMFPPIMLGVPLYLLFNYFRLRNTYLGLILAHGTIVLPFGLWLMWQFFQTVPLSYEESAWVSGAGRLRTFLEIAIPLASPGIITISIFSFALSWSDFEFAFILTTAEEMQTLPLAIYKFVTGYVHWGPVQAAAVLVSIPALLVVLFLQGYLIRGLGAGGLK